MKEKRRIMMLLLLVFASVAVMAQKPRYAKMSPFVRQAARVGMRATTRGHRVMSRNGHEAVLTAFVKTDDGGAEQLSDKGCRVLASFGDIHIAAIPLSRLPGLSAEPWVKRIESGPRATALMDSTAMHVDALPVYKGTDLPQAYTGKGVVVGVQDIGFDLTHPNFWSRDMSHYRIGALWDQLSTDTVGSQLYVGADYVGKEALLRLGHSRDGLDQSHGTHTTGIAAGSGYNSPYVGMAPDADICLVANATSEDFALIDSADYYKYTYATDALGFKYIFDYADRLGEPCVINFSEGSTQDFHGYDQLYYAILDKLTGPGHILVASAGNNGARQMYMHKPAGKASAGSFLFSNDSTASFTILTDKDCTLRVSKYVGGSKVAPVQFSLPTAKVRAAADSTLTGTWAMASGDTLRYALQAYPCSYDSLLTCYDVALTNGKPFGLPTTKGISVEVIGSDADVRLYVATFMLYPNPINKALNDAEFTHSVYSPASAPGVIAVGATTWRHSFINYLGKTCTYVNGTIGKRADYSSVGPTFDERMKPDVMAPGHNVISSYSSWYYEQHPSGNDINSVVKFFTYDGRTYLWVSNAGTSMAAPVVTGAIALWLQAYPKLTPEDCMSVFAATCSHPEESLTYPNNSYGYGEIDVYQGLKEVLKIKDAGISDIGEQRPADSYTIYNISGQAVGTVNKCNRHWQESLPRGIYIVGGMKVVVK